jgi:hypothetical protein
MVAVLAGDYIATQTSCNGKVGSFLQPQVTIADLKAKQSVLADSLVTLHDVQIESCESVLNYSKAVITDGSGEKILLLSDKPFKSGETTDVSGRMVVVYQKDSQSCLVFVDSRLAPMNDLLQLMKGSVGL